MCNDLPSEAGVLNRRILEVLPQIGEANVMAEELKKDAKYDVQLVTPEMQGKLDGQTEVCFQCVAPANVEALALVVYSPLSAGPLAQIILISRFCRFTIMIFIGD